MLYDYHLRPTSPLIDAGDPSVKLGIPFAGKAPDIGRYDIDWQAQYVDAVAALAAAQAALAQAQTAVADLTAQLDAAKAAATAATAQRDALAAKIAAAKAALA